jgi:hypothetical protein
MISELKDDEILEFLMTSDFEDDYSPTELKYLLTKWRYFYRLQHGNHNRISTDYEGKLQNLSDEVNRLKFERDSLLLKTSNDKNTIDSLKKRKITLK